MGTSANNSKRGRLESRLQFLPVQVLEGGDAYQISQSGFDCKRSISRTWRNADILSLMYGVHLALTANAKLSRLGTSIEPTYSVPTKGQVSTNKTESTIEHASCKQIYEIMNLLSQPITMSSSIQPDLSRKTSKKWIQPCNKIESGSTSSTKPRINHQSRPQTRKK